MTIRVLDLDFLLLLGLASAGRLPSSAAGDCHFQSSVVLDLDLKLASLILKI